MALTVSSLDLPADISYASDSNRIGFVHVVDSSISNCSDVKNSIDCEMPITRRKITVNGVELYCVRKGDGAHPILCIPGALAPCEWSFPFQLEHFGRQGSGFTIIAFDPRGYGYSRPPERHFRFENGDNHLKSDAIDGYCLMKELGFATFSVIGWCDGGISAIYLAALFPSVVKKVIMVGSRSIIREFDLSKTRELEKIEGWGPKFAEAFIPVYNGVDGLLEIMKRFTTALGDFVATDASDGQVCLKEMSRVKCPTLVVHGDKDILIQNYQVENLMKNIEGCQLQVIAGGRHNSQMEPTNKTFNTIVESFLS